MVNKLTKFATAAVCSLVLTTLAVAATVDGHASTSAASAVYASAGAGETANA